ncbi:MULTISPECIES: Asp-tRNA(Asn)/Glu-tRNA(Gln) amidotransferase subunit GatC [unclassified Spiroplasma]|uniref:Asp-tRNA(Asn)/Glu-tRNA(Gln) amidotransferase subunit GatC n=1 Tax=unclassified Spiroplasma TaxID=2637901 RepID=UPI0030D60CC1
MDKIEKKMTTKMLHEFANELMFNLSEEQCENLLLEFKAIEKQMEIVTNINTNDIEPLNYPFPIINNLLRSDNVGTHLTSKSVLNIAPEVENNYISINQVINHEN